MKREENQIAWAARSRALTDLKLMHPEDYDKLFAKHVANLMLGIDHVSRKKSYGTATHTKGEDGNCTQCGKAYPCSPARRRLKRGYEKE